MRRLGGIVQRCVCTCIVVHGLNSSAFEDGGACIREVADVCKDVWLHDMRNGHRSVMGACFVSTCADGFDATEERKCIRRNTCAYSQQLESFSTHPPRAARLRKLVCGATEMAHSAAAAGAKEDYEVVGATQTELYKRYLDDMQNPLVQEEVRKIAQGEYDDLVKELQRAIKENEKLEAPKEARVVKIAWKAMDLRNELENKAQEGITGDKKQRKKDAKKTGDFTSGYSDESEEETQGKDAGAKKGQDPGVASAAGTGDVADITGGLRKVTPQEAAQEVKEEEDELTKKEEEARSKSVRPGQMEQYMLELHSTDEVSGAMMRKIIDETYPNLEFKPVSQRPTGADGQDTQWKYTCKYDIHTVGQRIERHIQRRLNERMTRIPDAAQNLPPVPEDELLARGPPLPANVLLAQDPPGAAQTAQMAQTAAASPAAGAPHDIGGPPAQKPVTETERALAQEMLDKVKGEERKGLLLKWEAHALALTRAFCASPPDELKEFALTVPEEILRMTTAQLVENVCKDKITVRRTKAEAQEQMHMLFKQMAQSVTREMVQNATRGRAASRNTSAASSSTTLSDADASQMTTPHCPNDDPAQMVVVESAKPMRDKYAEMSRTYGFDYKLRRRFCELTAHNASRFVRDFRVAPEEVGQIRSLNAKAMAFLNLLRGGHDGVYGGNEGAKWWADPACFIDEEVSEHESANKKGRRKRSRSRAQTGRGDAGRARHHTLIENEALYHEGILYMCKDMYRYAPDYGEDLLKDFYHTAVNKHKTIANWEGNGGEFGPARNGITFKYYMAHEPSHLNVILMAQLMVKEESFFEHWRANMQYSRRDHVHKSVCAELKRLKEWANDYFLTNAEIERREKLVRHGDLYALAWDTCREYDEHGECEDTECKYLHMDLKR